MDPVRQLTRCSSEKKKTCLVEPTEASDTPSEVFGYIAVSRKQN